MRIDGNGFVSIIELALVVFVVEVRANLTVARPLEDHRRTVARPLEDHWGNVGPVKAKVGNHRRKRGHATTITMVTIGDEGGGEGSGAFLWRYPGLRAVSSFVPLTFFEVSNERRIATRSCWLSGRTYDQSTNRPIGQSANRPISQSTNRPITRPFPRSQQARQQARQSTRMRQ